MIVKFTLLTFTKRRDGKNLKQVKFAGNVDVGV